MSNDAKTKEKVRIAVFFSLCILLVVGIFVSIGSGTVSLSVSETWAALLGEADADTDRIVNLIRLPRTIVTVLVGATLALAGCNLQGVLHNPLADPGIIGVSAGAGLFAMVIMLLFPEQSAMVPLAAFVGAVLSTGIVFFLAWEKGINPLRMILAGVAVATFFGGGMAALNVFYSDRIQGTVMWMAGGFQGRSWGHVEMLLPYSAIGIIGTILCARFLNALQLGDELAKSLGVRVMRLLIGSDHEYLLPCAAIAGGAVVTLADTAARTLFSPLEIPVGIFMSFIGGPFFLYLLKRRMR